MSSSRALYGVVVLFSLFHEQVETFPRIVYGGVVASAFRDPSRGCLSVFTGGDGTGDSMDNPRTAGLSDPPVRQ